MPRASVQSLNEIYKYADEVDRLVPNYALAQRKIVLDVHTVQDD